MSCHQMGVREYYNNYIVGKTFSVKASPFRVKKHLLHIEDEIDVSEHTSDGGQKFLKESDKTSSDRQARDYFQTWQSATKYHCSICSIKYPSRALVELHLQKEHQMSLENCGDGIYAHKEMHECKVCGHQVIQSSHDLSFHFKNDCAVPNSTNPYGYYVKYVYTVAAKTSFKTKEVFS